MSNTISNPSVSIEPSDSLNQFINSLKSQFGFDPDSDDGLEIIQLFKELEMTGKYDTHTIVVKLLMHWTKKINALCDKHEATLEQENLSSKHIH